MLGSAVWVTPDTVIGLLSIVVPEVLDVASQKNSSIYASQKK